MKSLMKKALFLMSVICLMFITPLSVHAAAKYKKLLPGVTYSAFDFNRDGVKDKFKYTSQQYSGEVVLTLNGKTTKIDIAKGCTVYYYSYSVKNTFIFLVDYTAGDSYVTIYRYTGTKLTKVRTVAYEGVNKPYKYSGLYFYFQNYPYLPSYMPIFSGIDSIDDISVMVRYKVDTTNNVLKVDSLIAKSIYESTFLYSGTTIKTSSSYSTINTSGMKLVDGNCYILKKKHVQKPLYYFEDEKGNGGWIDGRRKDANFS